ncbi:MAG TPA: ribosome silencing factor [Pirellulales bacterium]|nr:ribosome silencing factor [Pirellulales bacterium]
MATSSVSRYVETSRDSNRALQLALAAAQTAADNRGRDILVLDMREVTPEFDYFVVATGTSRRQLHAMSEEIDHRLEDEMGEHRLGVEGYVESRWILLDYGNIVIHLFDDEARDYYSLEKLWCTAKRVPTELSQPDKGKSDDGEDGRRSSLRLSK